MSAWAAALIGVGGTLAGTALGGWFTFASERARWVREQSARWADDRRKLYAQVIAECEYLAEEVTSTLQDKERPTIGDLVQAIRPSREALRPLVNDLELIGTERDARAARDLHAAAMAFLNYAVRNPDAPAMPAYEEWGTALETFRAQAREGLHLSRPRSGAVTFPVTFWRWLVSLRGGDGAQRSA